MEFVGFAEVWPELARNGIVEANRPEGERALDVDQARSPSIMEIGPGAKGGAAVDVASEAAAATLEVVLHKLHLTPLFLVPFGAWRHVFDVVAFGLAKNAHWQEIDSQASVELNTRDPLVCEGRDLHTLRELVRTLMTDGESASSGLAVVATAQPMVAHVVPKRPIRIAFSNGRMASQALDAAQHFLCKAR